MYVFKKLVAKPKNITGRASRSSRSSRRRYILYANSRIQFRMPTKLTLSKLMVVVFQEEAVGHAGDGLERIAVAESSLEGADDGAGMGART